MPTIKTIGPHRFFFYAGDGKEPAHIHVKRDAAQAKFWLQPVRLHKNKGFSRVELRQIERIVKTNENYFYEEWIKFFARED